MGILSDYSIGVFAIIVLLLFFVGIVLSLRHFFCWYFKFNKIVQILEKNQKLQEKLLKKLDDEDWDRENS